MIRFTTIKWFLKNLCYVKPEIDLYGIVHVKVDFIVALKMYVSLILGRFVQAVTLTRRLSSRHNYKEFCYFGGRGRLGKANIFMADLFGIFYGEHQS